MYRTHEAIMHYAEAIKTLINEQCGDGIMSAVNCMDDEGRYLGCETLIVQGCNRARSKPYKHVALFT